MSIANIVINDAAGTPVAHTFVPIGKVGNVLTFEDQSATNIIGRWRITIEVRRPILGKKNNGNERNYRVLVGMHQPVLEVPGPGASPIIPAPTLAYIPRGLTEYILSERTTDLDRDNISKMLPLLLQNAQVRQVVEDLVELS